jgi:hypothetical protein
MRSELRAAWRILTFQATREELEQLNQRHLLLGFCLTWLAGIGRWWDDPRASLGMHLGLGSLGYVVVLATMLFGFTYPLRPRNWRWRSVLTYVTLMAPPAFLYALPVERWLGLDAASTVNVWILLGVAVWRVALWRLYLRRMAGLNWSEATVASSLPLMLIILLLVVLNLERAVFDLMRGARNYTPHDQSFELLFTMLALSCYAVLPLLIWYAIQWEAAAKRTPQKTASPADSPHNATDA